jgi:hypothetical protein
MACQNGLAQHVVQAPVEGRERMRAVGALQFGEQPLGQVIGSHGRIDGVAEMAEIVAGARQMAPS